MFSIFQTKSLSSVSSGDLGPLHYSIRWMVYELGEMKTCLDNLIALREGYKGYTGPPEEKEPLRLRLLKSNERHFKEHLVKFEEVLVGAEQVWRLAYLKELAREKQETRSRPEVLGGLKCPYCGSMRGGGVIKGDEVVKSCLDCRRPFIGTRAQYEKLLSQLGK